MSKPKQSSLFNFFGGKSNFYESDVKFKKDIKNTINMLIATIEKNATKIGSKRKPVRNTLDSEMTEDNIKQVEERFYILGYKRWEVLLEFWQTRELPSVRIPELTSFGNSGYKSLDYICTPLHSLSKNHKKEIKVKTH